MKETSLEANRKAELFKTSHKRKILAVMDGKMNTKQIAEASGLDYHAVARRVSELERENKIATNDSKDGFGLYELTTPLREVIK